MSKGACNRCEGGGHVGGVSHPLPIKVEIEKKSKIKNKEKAKKK